MSSEIIIPLSLEQEVTIFKAVATAGNILVTKTPATVVSRRGNVFTAVLDNMQAHGHEQFVTLNKSMSLTAEHALMQLYEDITSRELQLELDLASVRSYKNQIDRKLRHE